VSNYSPRLILLSPEPGAISETFIQAHRERLPFIVVPLFRWRAPYQTSNGRWVALLPGSLKLIADRLRWHLLQQRASRWADFQVGSWLRRFHPCVVLAEYGPLGAGINPACRLAGIPLVVIFHGFDAYQQITLQAYHHAYQELFASAAALVVVSEPMREQLISLGAPASRIVVNACGVDPSLFQPAHPAKAKSHFLAVGRFVGKKGPLHTIRAFSQVHRACPESRLTMIGTGPLLKSSQQLVEDLGLDHVIRFPGACSHASVQAQLQQARAFVQHSICCASGDQEGTPVALIEAQMAGIPVVSTQHGGIPTVVLDGRTGFLVPEGDVDGMAQAMLRLAQDPLLAGKLGSAARAHAIQHHSMERHIDSLAETLHNAIRHFADGAFT
jgi:colanic acid/amylovoran biosynthesis glycosyltransferase